MYIREASSNDNDGLLHLTKLCPMKGVISVCIDRQPDFFALVRKRGESVVLVAIKDERIIGAISGSKQTVWLNEKPALFYYIADFKVHPAYRGSSVGLSLARNIYKLVLQSQAGFFCTFANGNDRILPFFSSRVGLPTTITIGRFQVLQLFPSPSLFQNKLPILDRIGNPVDLPLLSFYHECLRKYQLGPIVQKGDLDDCRHLVMVDNKKIVAAISMMDTSQIKQNVITGLPWYLKFISLCTRIASNITPILPLPKIGEPLLMWNIRYLGCLEGSEDMLFKLIDRARNIAWKEIFLFLSIGLHERDPLLFRFRKIPHITFISNGMISLPNDGTFQLEDIKNGIPFEDFALV